MPCRPRWRLHASGIDYEEQTRRLIEALRAWVELERDELERTGGKPSQLCLRRARIAEYVAEPDFTEAVRGLVAVGEEVAE